MLQTALNNIACAQCAATTDYAIWKAKDGNSSY
jgi:hypothetical protein